MNKESSDHYATLCNLAFNLGCNAKNRETMDRCQALHKKYRHLFKQAAARELKLLRMTGAKEGR